VVHTVGVADMIVSKDPEDTIITHALGSCLGVTVHDPVAQVGGLLHVMLPLSTIDPTKASTNPHMFVDTGVPQLFLACYKLGAQKSRVILKVAGGACSKANPDDDFFEIGKRNFVMLRKLLWKNGVLIKAHDVGGAHSRTMSLHVGSGDVTLQINGSKSII
jgi:chemotaxis protein CheD